VADGCPDTVTTTSCEPGEPAGATAVSVVDEVTSTPFAELEPNATDVDPATKLVPVIVTSVPPKTGPVSG